MEENKTVEVEVVEKESLLEMIKANKKTIIKRGLIIAGSIVGLVAAYKAAYKLMKADQEHYYDDLTVDTDISGDGEATVEVEISDDEPTEEK